MRVCSQEDEQRCREHGALADVHDAMGELCMNGARLRAERNDAVRRVSALLQQMQLTPQEREAFAGREDGCVRLRAVRDYLDRIGVEFEPRK